MSISGNYLLIKNTLRSEVVYSIRHSDRPIRSTWGLAHVASLCGITEAQVTYTLSNQGAGKKYVIIYDPLKRLVHYNK